ncbi:uncharacterized protein LOC108428136 [Pygocentrus nattereri]|uniref:uncharacterized protein LOC108428136 n=1 Tax=Pygocentrus nattereri TaxID=42514 RepID=UPI00081498E0|nr:uncharacterized protein LOC108428136 [Pygocentrus nattereri]
MQVYTTTPPTVQRSNLRTPQQTPCSRQPGPTSQSGYCTQSVQQRTLNQWNAPQFVGLNNGQSFSSSVQPHSSSARLQSSPVSRNDLPGPQQTLSSEGPGPTSQTTYYNVQQNTLIHSNNNQSLCLRNGQSSQPNSGLQSNQTPPFQITGPRSQLLYSSASLKGPCPNVTVQFQQSPAAHVKVPTVSYHSQLSHTNTTSQGCNNIPPIQNVSWFPSVSSSGSSVLENNQAQASVPSRHHPSSVQYNRMQIMHQPAAQPQQTSLSVQLSQTAQRIQVNQGQIRAIRNGTSYSSTAQSSAAAQAPIVPSLLPSYGDHHTISSRGQSQHNVNQVQNSSCRTQNVSHSWVKQGQSGATGFVIQSQPGQTVNQSSSVSLPQPQVFGDILKEVRKMQAVQRNTTVPISGHHSTASLPSFQACQCNAEPQGLQENITMAMLTRTSQDITSPTFPASQAQLPTFSRPNKYSKETLLSFLLQRDHGQVQSQSNSPLSCSSSSFRAQVFESRGGRQQTASPTTSVADYPQTPASILHNSIPSNPSKRVIQRVGPAPPKDVERAVEGKQSSRLQTERSDKRPREVEHCTEPAECLELVMALQKAVRQFHRAVAIVPPISHQADPGEKEDGPQSADDSLPLKINAVWSLDKDGESLEKEIIAPSLPEEISKEPLELSSVKIPQTQEAIKQGNRSTVNIESCTPSETQSFEVPQAENRPTSKSPSSNTSQAPFCCIDLSESPVQQSVQNESHSVFATFDLSSVPVTAFTLEKLRHLVKSLEDSSAEKEKETATDLRKSVLALYWDGDVRNILKERQDAQWLNTINEMCITEEQTEVLQSLEPENLKRLSCHYQVLENEITFSDQFRSSWLNVDGSPADIDKVLAEPVSEYDFTWCKDSLQSVLDSTMNPDNGLVQTGGKEEDQALSTQKESSETTSSNIAVNPEHALVEVGGNDDSEDLLASTQKGSSETTADNATKQNVISDSGLSEPECVAANFQNNAVVLKKPVNISLKNQEHIQLNCKTNPCLQNVNRNSADSAEGKKYASCISNTSQEPLSTRSGPIDYTQVTLLDLLLQNNCGQVDGQGNSYLSCTKTSFRAQAESRGGYQQAASPTTSVADYSQAQASVSHNSTPSNPSKGEIQRVGPATPKGMSENTNPADFMHSAVKQSALSENERNEYQKYLQDTRRDMFSPPVSPKSNQNIIEQKNRKDDEQMCAELPVPPSHLNGSDQHVENYGSTCEREDVSNASSPNDSLLMDIIVLSSDDVTTIFKCNKQNEAPPDDSKLFAMLPLTQPNDLYGRAVIPPSHVRFTCPHVTDIISDDGHFCSKCWDETPLLDIDLEEALLSPEEGGPNITSSPIRPVETQLKRLELTQPTCSDNARITESVLVAPEVDDSEIIRAPAKPGVERQSPSPQSGNLPVQELFEPAVSSKPVLEEICGVESSARAELPSAIAHSEKTKSSQTNILVKRLSSSKYLSHKKRKLSKALAVAADDDLFSHDVMKAGAHKQQSGVHSFTSSGDGQNSGYERNKKVRGEEKRTPIKIVIQTIKHSTQTETVGKAPFKLQVSNAFEPHQPKNIIPQKLEGTICSPQSGSAEIQHPKHGLTKQAGQKKSVKNVKFLLYGTKNSNRDFLHKCHDGGMSSSAPVYISVSAATHAGMSYTDVPSAKQKVYSQWSSSFVQKQNTFSRRKYQKKFERELKNRIEIQKQIMRERAMYKPGRGGAADKGPEA